MVKPKDNQGHGCVSQKGLYKRVGETPFNPYRIVTKMQKTLVAYAAISDFLDGCTKRRLFSRKLALWRLHPPRNLLGQTAHLFAEYVRYSR
jgi:hypothetical protein